MLTIETLSAVYESLKAATAEAFTAMEAAGLAKEAVEAGKTALLLAGKLDGKNEAQREAQARDALGPLFDSLQATEQAARVKRHVQELARLDVELTRAQLRLLELAEASAG